MNDNKRRTRRATLTFEPLEGRLALSTMHPGAALVHAAQVKGQGHLVLNGTAQGTTQKKPGNPDAPPVYTLQGQGQISPLGSVSVTGSLHGVGFIRSGNDGGTVVLTNSKGSVTLDLVGPTEPGFTPPMSGIYHFTVTGGTGAYAHSSGHGTVDVNLGDGTFHMTFHGAPKGK